MKRIAIIDGYSLIFRAFYAMQRPMITSEGIYTQGIFGFLNMLNKIQEDFSPEYMAVAFDLKEPTFRHKEYEGYKAGRKPAPPELLMEIPLLKDILRAMNIRMLEVPGFEADDIIGTVSRIAEEQGYEPLIFTGDKDALQLTSDITKVVFTRKGVTDFDLYDREKMQSRYGLTPSQFIDLKGIMGDSSDNIPGIPGIGEKGGIELLTRFGSLEEVLEHSGEIKKPAMRKKVEENADLARLSKRLATIIRDVPLDCSIEDMILTEPDYAGLTAMYKKLEFKSFLKRLGTKAAAENQVSFDPSELEFKGEKIRIEDKKDLCRLYDLKGGDVFVEVFGDFSHTDGNLIESMVLVADNAYYIDLKLVSIEELNNTLRNIDFRIWGHDIKSTLFVMMSLGIELKELTFDTSIAEYVIDVSKKDYSLKAISTERLDYDPEMGENTEGNQMSMFSNAFEDSTSKAVRDERISRVLRKIQEAEIADKALEDVYYGCELPLAEVLASMECTGILCDRDFLNEFGKNLDTEINALEEEIYKLAGAEFNIKSTQQLGDILFDKLGLPHGKKTKKGYSTSAEVLEKVKDDHPIVPKILEYRNLTKLASTYIEGMKPLIAEDGRIHCHFQQTVTQTGRISCTEPNLQNIPVRQELGRKIRKAFHAEKGKVLVGADYSQIELRVLAHLSEDEALIEAFNNNEDIHRMTAARVLGIPLEEVRPIDRSRAKAVNFGVIYGMSGFGLSEEINVTRKEAEAYIKEYFNKHPGVKAYMDSLVALAKKKGYAETILGRRRKINEINAANNFMVRQLGERLAMNTPIQGSAADIIKIAMIKVYGELKEKHPKSRLVLQVHDELIIEADIRELEDIRELLVRNMQEAMKLRVELLVDLNTAENWYDLK